MSRTRHNEEYEYKGEEVPTSEFKETPTGPSPVTSLAARRVLLPIIIIAAIVSVYFFMGHKDTKKPDQTAKSTKTMAVKLPEKTKPTTVATTSSLMQASQTMQSNIAQLTAQVKQNTNQMNQLQDGFDRLRMDVANLSTAVNGIRASVESIDRDVTVLKAAKRPIKAVKPRRRKVVSRPRRAYSIIAVVPGRAWLRAADGSTTTIRVGDHLGSYGRVNLIVPERGIIYTSSGRAIRYGQDDS